MQANRKKLQSPMRKRLGLNKIVDVTYKLGKTGLAIATLTLPGGKIYKGAKAAQKFAQSKKVEKLLKARRMRRAKKMAAGEDIMMDGRKLSDFMKKLGVK
jgi:hypothetical protein